MTHRILVVDDEASVTDLLSYNLRKALYEVRVAADGRAALQFAKDFHPDLILLDLMLPEVDGLDVCKKIRETNTVPIIILTVRDQSTDIVRGLEAGADDYITKPFNQMEFLARVQAVLRRGQPQLPDERERVFQNGELVINFAQREVRVRGDLVKLTPTEYNLLYQLASNPGKPMSHRDLLSKVWGQEYVDANDYLKVHMQHLRRKLGDNPDDPHVISTERGVGYRFIARMAA